MSNTKIIFNQYKIYVLLTWLCFLPSSMHAQQSADSLSGLSYDALITKCRQAHNQDLKEFYLLEVLERAKLEKDMRYLSRGYHLGALITENETRLNYCDSLIILTRDRSNTYYPAAAYILRGNSAYRRNDFKSALDDYLEANRYAKTHANVEYTMESNYYIGLLKDKVGEHAEALKLHKDNYNSLKRDPSIVSDSDYLTYMFALANSYNELQQLDSASYYNRLGVLESRRLQKPTKYYHFVLNEGITQHYNKRYLVSLDSIHKALDYLKTQNDEQNCAIGYFYAGRS